MQKFSLLFILLVLAYAVYSNDCSILLHNTDTGLKNNYINALEITKSNYLVVATNGGIYLYNGRTFSELTNELPNPIVANLFSDKKRDVYVIDRNDNAYILDDLKLIKLNKKLYGFNNFKNLNNQFLNSTQRENAYFSLITLNQSNIKEIKDDKVVFYYNKAPKYESKHHKSFCFLVGTTLLCPIKDNSWHLCDTSGKSKTIISPFSHDIKRSYLIFHSYGKSFILYEKVIYELKIKNTFLDTIPILRSVNLDQKLNNLTNGIYHEESGHFFFGSKTEGLYEVIPNNFEIKNLNKNEKSKVIRHWSKFFYSQAETNDGNILIGNNLMFKKDKELTLLDVQRPFPWALNLKTDDGNLYYSDKNSIVKITPSNNKVRIIVDTLNVDLRSITFLDSNYFFAANTNYIFEIKDDKLVEKYSIDELCLESNEIINYIFFDKISKKLFILTNSTVWFSTIDKPLNFKKSNLPTAEYRIMQKLGDGLIYLGTYGHGYYIYYKNKWVKMPLDQAKSLSIVHAVMQDNFGFLWISSNEGLFQTRLDDIYGYLTGRFSKVFYFYYGKKNGLSSTEFNGGCQTPALYLTNGKLSFSNIKGLVQFGPNKTKPIFPQTAIKIYEIYQGEEKKSIANNYSKVDKNDQPITLKLNIPYFGHSTNLKIEYKIQQSMQKWIESKNNNEIFLPLFPAGLHQIDIRVRNGFGPNDFIFSRVTIYKPPYFYQTTWFYFSIIFIVLGLLSYFYYLRLKFKTEQNKMLLQMVDLKTNEISEINEILKTNIKNIELFQTLLIHDIQMPIMFIDKNIKLIVNAWSNLEDKTKINSIVVLSRSAAKLSLLLEDLIRWLKSNNSLHINKEKMNIYDLLKKTVADLSEHPKIIKGIVKISIQGDSGSLIMCDKNILDSIIRNLLSNSIKYSNSGEIILYSLEVESGKIIIGCKDQGLGMSEILVEKLMSQNYLADSIDPSGSKLGLFIIKELVKKLSGSMKIESKLGIGSDIRIILESNKIDKL